MPRGQNLGERVVYCRARSSGGYQADIVVGPTDYDELQWLPSTVLAVGLSHSDGRRVDTRIQFGESENARARYRKLVAIMDEAMGDVHGIREPGAPGSRLWLALWDENTTGGARRLDPWQMNQSVLGTRPGGREGIRLHGSARSAGYLQTVLGGGASVVYALQPGSEYLSFREVSLNEGGLSAAIPEPMGRETRAVAYGRFIAAGEADAARAVGKRLLRDVVDRPRGRLDPGEVAVACQWHLRSRGNRSVAVTLYGLLAYHTGDPDADVLSTLLSFRYPVSLGDHWIVLLRRTLATIADRPPILSETLSLLFDNLVPMRHRALSTRTWSEEDERHLGYARRLAASTIWECPQTAYLGREPGKPEPIETAERNPASKKKSDAAGQPTLRGSRPKIQ